MTCDLKIDKPPSCFKLAAAFILAVAVFAGGTHAAFGCLPSFEDESESAIVPPWMITPRIIQLRSPEATDQILVARLPGRQGKNIELPAVKMGDVSQSSLQEDWTRRVNYRSMDPKVVTVSSNGKVHPVGEGKTNVVVTFQDKELFQVPVIVSGLKRPAPVSFQQQVLPILTKSGCNSGGCHGKAEGQNGFRLSVFGHDVAGDFDAITKEARGRRVNPANPSQSLLLTKATSWTPHGGGARLTQGSVWYRLIHRWISEGVCHASEQNAKDVKIEIHPSIIASAPGQQHQLRVLCIDSNGNKRCITGEAEFRTNADQIANADSDGLISVGKLFGEAVILVRYLGKVQTCRVVVPRPSTEFRRPSEKNFIDKRVWDKLEQIGIPPSGPTDDAVFLRRVFLDTIGTLPTREESIKFLQNTNPNKRALLIDQLLERSEYSDYWAMKWADILRLDKAIVGPQGTVAMTRWLKEQVQRNTPYDQFVSRLLMARGNSQTKGPVAFYQVHNDPEKLARAVSQIFLGVRLECAQCHQHPFENLGQKDYFAFAGFFTGLKRVGAGGGSQKLSVVVGKDMIHPRTREPVPTAGIFAQPANLQEVVDRRKGLVEWMTGRTPLFSRLMMNRLWAHYLGRGLVDPIDDLRETNPASNEALLNQLAKSFVESGYNLKKMTRLILNSNVYQQSSSVHPINEMDFSNYSHAAWKPLPAEVLSDAISQATGVPQAFNGIPTGVRAIEIWDNRQPSYFFKIFGKPRRVSVCECERGTEPSIAQVLHLMNSPETVRKIRHRDGVAARLANSKLDETEIIKEIYLRALSRFPSVQEVRLMLSVFGESGNRRTATEDILWALLNTREFVFNH